MTDYYKVLEVDRKASDTEIKKAFRKKAMDHHPDRNKDNPKAEEKFKKVNEAYAVLSDKDKKKQYDRFGAKGFRQKFSQDDIFRGFNMEDAYRNFSGHSGGGPGGAGEPFQGNFDQFADPFREMFGGRPPRGNPQQRPTNGKDIEQEMVLDFEESIRGSEKILNLKRNGKLESNNVKIPPGIEDGKKLRLTGKGYPSPFGGKSGDILLKIKVKDHPIFKREGQNIILDKEISLTEAILGTTIEAPTLEGDKNVKIPPGSQNNSKLRLKGLGVLGKHGLGDQYINIEVKIPQNLTEEQINLFKQLKETGL
jgi:curved DNA-binding protein